MRLPYGDRAIIDAAKVRDYLLSSEHRVGRTKARFLLALGFERHAWERLRAALLDLAREGTTTMTESSVFGQKYVVRGMLRGPGGRTAEVVTVWIVLRGDEVPRFVTAYPGELPA